MISRWTSHLKDPKDIESFKQRLQGSKDVLDRLAQIMKEDEQNLSYSEIGHKSYETPNWSHLQAHKNGYRQCLYTYQKLTNLDPRSTND